ncbi:MAG TPA: S8 family serine peptidase [Flavisolibacter sp.]|nr:S8 family serine peptidase [Flavisolibacter sp.]
MKKWVSCLLAAITITQIGNAQSRHIIKFKDKGSNPYSLSNPAAYLSERAIERRNRYSIAIDSTDLPVTPRYIDSIRLSGTVTILNVSKWLNAVTIQTTDDAALAKINSFPFVQVSAPVAARIAAGDKKYIREQEEPLKGAYRLNGLEADIFNYGNAYAQVHIHNGEFLHNIGLQGQGIVIGMLDAGFQNYKTVQAFDSARANGQIKGTWDFVARDTNVNEDHPHGMQCFSTIAANIPGQFVGTAPKASFYLFRSEDATSEYPIEEHNWVCAAERVDSSGGDMISSSLGYYAFDAPLSAFNHSYADMNGNTTMAAIGADLAAKKGILVVNSAGNEGNNSWGKIITPADGDSVMAVGAVNSSGVPAGFTSRGPSSDGQVKPDVASVGVATVVQLQNGAIGTNNGTSFSAPNLAGLTACLWQGFPEFTNISIINALRKSGSRYSNPNDTIGYGIPDVKKAMLVLLNDYASSEAVITDCRATISWTSKDVAAMRYEIERKVSGQTGFTKVGEVYGTGTVFGQQEHQFDDDLSDVPSGSVTYRIRQVIDTSSAGFSAGYIDTTSVALTSACLSGSSNLTLMPNPSQGSVKIKLTTQTASDQILIRVYNTTGQMVMEEKHSKPAGVAFYDLSLFHLAAGNYYVSVYDEKKLVQTRELVKL